MILRLEPPLILTSLRLWEQGLCNGRASVCLSVILSVRFSVCLSRRSTATTAADEFAAELHAGVGDID